jgi:hypothetical protein
VVDQAEVRAGHDRMMGGGAAGARSTAVTPN